MLTAFDYTESDSRVGFLLRRLCSQFFSFACALCTHNGRSLQEKNGRSLLAKFPTFESRSVYTKRDSKVGFLLRRLCSQFFSFACALCTHNGRSLQEKNGRSLLAKFPTFESRSVYLTHCYSPLSSKQSGTAPFRKVDEGDSRLDESASRSRPRAFPQ